MRTHHVIAVIAAILVGVGLKLAFFTAATAEAPSGKAFVCRKLRPFGPRSLSIKPTPVQHCTNGKIRGAVVDVDVGFTANADVGINVKGEPVLKRRPRPVPSASAHALEAALDLARLPRNRE